MIVAEKLTKKFGDKVAVDNLSFKVESGRVTGFLGPNGAGKSTAMRLMLGLDSGGGTTLYDGKRLNDYPNPSKIVGILLDGKAFHPTRTARNHLRVLATIAGVDNDRVDEVLDIVGLSDVADGRPGKFSLGMGQRLGVAAAILASPKYLILDEPANGLDPEGIHWLRQFLRDYASNGGGVFVSSHLLSEMSLMADDIVVIGKGKLISEGSVSDVAGKASGTGVFVRSSKLSELKKILPAKYKVTSQANGLLIHGASSDEIGKLAFKAKLPLYELTNRTSSLEDTYLEITSASQEYKSATSKVSGAKK